MLPLLYMYHASPAVRAVLITAKAIQLNLNKIKIDVLKGEHLKLPYLKINPEHTVPAFVDSNGFTIWDSHAILIYLVTKYAKNDFLYPNDLEKRAIVNHRLFFESRVVSHHLKHVSLPLFLSNKADVCREDINKAYECYSMLEIFLSEREWIADDFVTIADYSLVSSISSFNLLVPVSSLKYPNVYLWLRKCENLPEYKANAKGLKDVEIMLKNVLK